MEEELEGLRQCNEHLSAVNARLEGVQQQLDSLDSTLQASDAAMDAWLSLFLRMRDKQDAMAKLAKLDKIKGGPATASKLPTRKSARKPRGAKGKQGSGPSAGSSRTRRSPRLRQS